MHAPALGPVECLGMSSQWMGALEIPLAAEIFILYVEEQCYQLTDSGGRVDFKERLRV